MDAAKSEKDSQDAESNGDDRRDAAESTCFKLLNELSDLLMLPKDMLLDKTIRKEVSFSFVVLVSFPSPNMCFCKF